jgi:hypothetical protein
MRGQFVDGQLTGLGFRRYSSGAVFLGEMVKGRQHGSGRMVWLRPFLQSYEGDWVDGLTHGTGRFIWFASRQQLPGSASADSATNAFRSGTSLGAPPLTGFVGDHRTLSSDSADALAGGVGGEALLDGKPSDPMTLEDVMSLGSAELDALIPSSATLPLGPYLQTANRYSGAFFQGQQHGPGVFVSADGSRFEGVWQRGQKTGPGVLQLADGSEFAVEYDHDVVVEQRQLSGSKGDGFDDLVDTLPGFSPADPASIATALNHLQRLRPTLLDVNFSLHRALLPLPVQEPGYTLSPAQFAQLLLRAGALAPHCNIADTLRIAMSSAGRQRSSNGEQNNAMGALSPATLQHALLKVAAKRFDRAPSPPAALESLLAILKPYFTSVVEAAFPTSLAKPAPPAALPPQGRHSVASSRPTDASLSMVAAITSGMPATTGTVLSQLGTAAGPSAATAAPPGLSGAAFVPDSSRRELSQSSLSVSRSHLLRGSRRGRRPPAATRPPLLPPLHKVAALATASHAQLPAHDGLASCVAEYEAILTSHLSFVASFVETAGHDSDVSGDTTRDNLALDSVGLSAARHTLREFLVAMTDRRLLSTEIGSDGDNASLLPGVDAVELADQYISAVYPQQAVDVHDAMLLPLCLLDKAVVLALAFDAAETTVEDVLDKLGM